MAISKMDTLIKILDQQISTADNGVQTIQYVSLFITRCAVDYKPPTSGSWINDTATVTTTKNVKFRAKSGITVTPAMYAELENQRYRILGVVNHHNMYTECTLTAIENVKGAAYGTSDSSNP